MGRGSTYARDTGTCSPFASGGVWGVEQEVPDRRVELLDGPDHRPRVSARRRIPAHAFALKKYLGGVEPGGSITCHNEDAAAPLGHSEMLRVQNSPRRASFGSDAKTSAGPARNVSPARPIPTPQAGAFSHCGPGAGFEGPVGSCQSAEETPEGVVRGGQDSGNILPNAHSRTNRITDLHVSKTEVAALVGFFLG